MSILRVLANCAQDFLQHPARAASWAVCLCMCLCLAPVGLAWAHEPTLSRYNYHDDVRPLFVEHCGGCHHSGGPAPMSLLDYQEAVPWANAIKLQILEGHMPPFLPDDESGPFLHRRGLAAEEIDIIVDWTVGATPEGEPVTDSDESSSSAKPWSGAKPDLVLEPDERVVIGEDESEKTACVTLPTALDRPRVLSSLELAPGTPTILRRATVYLGDSCAQGEPLLTWLPDQEKTSYPEGWGREIRASETLALELRYKKGWGQEGKRMTDRSALGLWFSAGATPVTSMRIEHQRTLGMPAKLVGLFPDLSVKSDDSEPLRVEAVLPGGKTEVLLSMASPDSSWVETYFFRTPLFLPRGTELRVSGPSTPVWADFVPVGSAATNDHDPQH